MSAIGFSIEPREEDREEAMKIVLTELVGKSTDEDITEYLIQKQQVIIRAERLREAVMRQYEGIEPEKTMKAENVFEKVRG